MWIFFQQLFMLTSKPPFTPQWKQCGEAWKLKRVVSIQDRPGGGKYILWDSASSTERKTLREVSSWRNIRTVRFTTDGSLRLLSVGIFIHSSERQGSGTVLQQSARKLYWCRLHFSSACFVRMYCVIIEDHKCMWVIPCPLQCTILQCAS